MGSTTTGAAARHKDRLRQEAAERQEAYDQLTQAAKLGRALARGHSGTREVKRLRKGTK